MLFIFSVFIIMTLFLIKICTKDRIYRWFYYLMVIGFTIYSGVGIFTEAKEIEHNAFVYLIQFMLFLVFFMFGSIAVRKVRTYDYMPFLDDLTEKKFIYVMAAIYISTYVYCCIFSGVTFAQLINIQSLFTNYKATTFAVRVARRNNVLYNVITNQVASISAPFFYIALYNKRKNHRYFLAMYCLPILLAILADGYISRNKIAVHIAFIYIYFCVERIIPKNFAKKIVLIAIPLMLFLFAVLQNIRSGNSSEIGFGDSIKDLILSEVEYPKYYDYCVRKSKEINTINFLIYIFIVWVPSQFYHYIGITVPNLAYSFTEAVIGLSYGETNNYYILLPSVLGEALMLFGKYAAFLYGLIYGVFSTWFLKVLKGHDCLYYLMIYYLLDFFRQFRGGSQYVISAWETQIIPFILIIIIASIPYEKKRRRP